MRCARIFQQTPRQWIRPAARIAAICLIATTCDAQSKPVASATRQPQASLTRELNKYPGLLHEFAQLFSKLQNNVQYPASRSESHLLPLLPATRDIGRCSGAC